MLKRCRKYKTNDNHILYRPDCADYRGAFPLSPSPLVNTESSQSMARRINHDYPFLPVTEGCHVGLKAWYLRCIKLINKRGLSPQFRGVGGTRSGETVSPPRGAAAGGGGAAAGAGPSAGPEAPGTAGVGAAEERGEGRAARRRAGEEGRRGRQWGGVPRKGLAAVIEDFGMFSRYDATAHSFTVASVNGHKYKPADSGKSMLCSKSFLKYLKKNHRQCKWFAPLIQTIGRKKGVAFSFAGRLPAVADGGQ